MSLDDSTPENMSKLMALRHKTLHDPIEDNNFITGKLTAILQARSNQYILHKYHIAFACFESPNGYIQNLGPSNFQIFEQMFVQAT
jgi:hypothetical protein